MDNRLLDQFSKATADSLRLLLDIDVQEAPCPMGSWQGGTDAICIAIPVVGALNGNVVYCFPVNTALEFVEIMSGMKVAQADDFVISAVSEIANIISGNAVSGLAGRNIVCDIRPPHVVPDAGMPGPDASLGLVHTRVGNVNICVDIH